MATIASLDIALGANSANLKRDLDKASTATKKFSSKAKGHAAAVTSAFKAVAVGIAAISAAMGASALLSNADALIKNANGAGIAFEAYQRLAFGLEQAGLSQDSLQKGMKKLNTIMATAGDGTKSAVEDLAALGLTFEQLQGMSPEERFRAVVDGLNGIQDEGARSAIAMKVLGKEFADRKFSSEDLDNASSGLVTITTAAAMAAEGFGDSVNLMQTNMSNMATNMIATVVPYVQIAVDTFNQFSANHPTMTGILTGLAAAGAAIIGLGVALTVVGAPFLAIAAAIAAAIAGIVFAVNNWDIVLRGFTEFLANTFNISVEQAAGWITSMGDAIRVAGEWAVTAGAWFVDYWVSAMKLSADAIRTAITFVYELFSAVSDFFAMDFAGFGEHMMNALSAVKDFFVSNFGEAITQIVHRAKELFTWAFETVGIVFGNIIGGVVDSIMGNIKGALNFMIDKYNEIIANAPEALGLTIDNQISKFAPGGTGFVPTAPSPFPAGSNTGTGLTGAVMPPMGVTTGTGLTSPIMPPSNTVITPTDPTKPSGKGGGGGGKSEAEKSAEEAQKALEKLMQETADAAKSFSDNILSDMSSAFSTGLKTGDWKEALNGYLDTITTQIIDSFSQNLMESLFGNVFEDIFKKFGETVQDGLSSAVGGAGAGGGGGGGLLSFLGGIGTGIMSIFGFADGGIVPTTSTSRSYKDSVPAMLQPGELVVPVDEVGQFVGNSRGKGSSVNINVTGDISRQTRREIMEMIPQITQGVNSANKETNYDYR